MVIRLIKSALVFLLIGLILPGSAEALTWMDAEGVTICPTSVDKRAPPDFSSTNCKSANAAEIDPQQKMLWVKANIRLDKTAGPNGEPLALYISGKMSSEFYLNGKFVGRNGIPALDATSEVPGQMDVTLYPSQSLFKKGNNEIVFKASSHNGFLKLANPVHIIAIGISGRLTDELLRHYWPSILTLGLFILGALYFGITGAIGLARKKALTLCLICTFAAAQLSAEVSRGLFAYSYPIHDIRLMAITLFSGGFGLTVAFHIFSTFMSKQIWPVIISIAVFCVIGVAFTQGYDGKAEMAILIPLGISLLASGYWCYERRRRAFGYFLTLLIFVAAILAFPSLFLDTVFFYLVAAFLLFLFVEQGFSFAQEVNERRLEEARANRLELALGQAREREQASEIIVKSAGKMERISTNQIGYCRGASGYAEIMLLDGREILHSVTLAELEDTLPATFLRVHRSYLVNTEFVQSLERDPAGTGMLTLTDGSEIPVSRRVMPQVRQALA